MLLLLPDDHVIMLEPGICPLNHWQIWDRWNFLLYSFLSFFLLLVCCAILCIETLYCYDVFLSFVNLFTRVSLSLRHALDVVLFAYLIFSLILFVMHGRVSTPYFSCPFSHGRYLKRGINEKGRAANDVETEQIVFEEVDGGRVLEISSVVQIRGSIPLFWSQETSRLNIKPDIICMFKAFCFRKFYFSWHCIKKKEKEKENQAFDDIVGNTSLSTQCPRRIIIMRQPDDIFKIL